MRIFNKVFLLGVFFLFIFCETSLASLEKVKTAVLKEDFEKAKQIASKMLQKETFEGDRQEVQYYLGICELYLGAHEKAADNFEKVIQITKNKNLSDRAWIGVISVHYLSGKYEQSLKEARALLKSRPDSDFLSLIYLKIARANLKLSHWDDARRNLYKISEEFPNSLEAHIAKQLLEEKTYFTVQIGAFLDQERAQRLVSELQSKGQYGYIVETIDKDGKKFYRVRVGEMNSLNHAKQVRDKLAEYGYPAVIYP